MRNKYPGYCYRCGGYVEKGKGHFERMKNRNTGATWRLQHADCAIRYRGTSVQGNGVRPSEESGADE